MLQFTFTEDVYSNSVRRLSKHHKVQT